MSGARKFAEAKDAEGKTVIEFMGPPRSDDALSECLRILTHQLKLRQPDADCGGGFFGGSYGYGVDFENDVFMMHHYCWCEKSECPWCRCCACPSAYFIDDKPVTEEQYHDFMWSKTAPKYDSPKYRAYFDRVRSERIEPKCAACADGAERRPNFEHKPSGFQVRWYKYIGRDNDIDAEPNRDITLHEMFTEVLASFGGPSLEEALKAYHDAEAESAEAMRKQFEFMASPEGQKAMQEMLDSGAVVVESFDFGKKDEPER